jgi:hypothetical protein
VEIEPSKQLVGQSVLKPEAQCAVAVLQRKFPDSPWSRPALEALKSAGLEPAEDQKNWIFQAFYGPRL